MTKRKKKREGGLKSLFNFKGDVEIGGDVVGGDKVVKGDVVGGDKISGSKITFGDVSDSVVSVGDGTTITVNKTFEDIRRRIDEEVPMPPDKQAEMEAYLTELEQMAQGSMMPPAPEYPTEYPYEPEPGMPPAEAMPPAEELPQEQVDRLDKILEAIEEIAPEAVEVIINAITNPGAAIGKGLKLAIKAWRAARRATGGSTPMPRPE